MSVLNVRSTQDTPGVNPGWKFSKPIMAFLRRISVFLLIVLAGTMAPVSADAAAPVMTSTFQSIGIEWDVSGSDTTEATIQYSADGGATWKAGHPMWWTGSEYRGSIVMLSPGTTYTIKLYLNGTLLETVQQSTWNENFPVGDTVYVNSGSGTLTITQSGSPNAYRLYTAPPGQETVLDAGGNSDHNIVINANYVIVRGLTLKGAREDAIDLRGGHDIVIENNDISGFATADGNFVSGIRCNGVSSVYRVIIQRNYIHHPAGDATEWCAPGNYYGPGGINLSLTGGNSVIRYNTVLAEGNNYFSDCMAFGSGGPDNPAGSDSENTDIYGNRISGCVDNAIESEKANKNTRIWGNYMDRSYSPIAITPTGQGPIYIFRNISDRSLKCPFSNAGNTDADKRGRFLKAGYNSSDRVYIYHNTIYQREPAAGAQYPLGLDKAVINDASGGSAGNMISRNNIFHIHQDGGSTFNGESVNDFDYDLYNGSVASGSEQNGVQGQPTYAPGNGPMEFFLDPSSLGVGVGLPLDNFNAGSSGVEPGIGAYQIGMQPFEFGKEAYSGGTGSNDTIPPEVTIISPGDGETLSGSVLFSAAATDNVGIYSVDFFLNGDLWYTHTTAPYEIMWDTNQYANGSHELSVTVRDAAGNTGTASVIVNVNNGTPPGPDQTPPSVLITSPGDNDTVGGTVTFSATATDNEAVSKVDFYVGTLLISSDSSQPYSVAWDTLNTTDGSHTLKAVATDTSGNSSEHQVSVTVDNSDCNTQDLVLEQSTVQAGETVSYCAKNSISAGNAYIVEAGGDLSLFAGNSINLRPGFSIDKGGKLLARVNGQ
ncbi:MAG: Ig-like domain-containing protein [Desulfobacterales bacterium]|nr:Ig-like domain-containing protein [Desulfobacterales bacterium]